MTAPALDTYVVEHGGVRVLNGGTAADTPPRDLGTAVQPSHATSVQAALKRTLDVVVSLLALLLAMPLMALIAMAIILDSPGPVFYRARRVGQGGRPLAMLKFRKMARDAGGLALTVAGDARLTRVGTVLAKTKLDELPQLLHVVRGDMSLVGPRPEDPRFVAERAADYDEILQVRPGITGLSQLAFAEESRLLSAEDPVGRYMSGILPQKCALDRMYVTRGTLRTDASVLRWTVLATALRRQVAVDRKTARLSLRRREARDQPPAGPGRPPPVHRHPERAGGRPA